ncbi:hypothetical protein J7481_06685 [Labrenzia sp. R4_2]|uniref:hypothetical protein n=1 Tax=Labrenzia sp. R4_2 TaxID=2821107 RepID=UPI001ADCC515|nr:hypothetical protein [Labrenzia sp. R4_2]MBO9419175.1 hypothetical protein [Labrenzia sp. R4_2]
MIAKGYFTKRELALVIGLDLMEVTLTEIAEDLGRSELDVATALTRAKALIPDPIVSRVLKTRRIPEPDTSKPLRRTPVKPVPLPITRPRYPAAPVPVASDARSDPGLTGHNDRTPAPGDGSPDQTKTAR